MILREHGWSINQSGEDSGSLTSSSDFAATNALNAAGR